MTMITLLHLADLHLGMETYGRLDPATGLNTRLQDFLRSFDAAVDEAIRRPVDLVVFAGDAYRSREPSPTQQREFAARLHRLSTHGIPVLLLVGNHDLPAMTAKAHALEVFAALEVPGVWVAREPAVYCIPTRSGPVQVACLPSLPPSRTAEGPLPAAAEAKARAGESLDAIVSQLAAELDPAVPAVLTAHVLVEGATLSSEANLMLGTEPMVSRAAIANPAFDYVALGHVHRFQDLNAGGRPPVVYAGSLDRIDFGEEKDEKGFVIAEIARGEARYEFVPVAARRFVTIRVAVEEGEATAPIAAAIARADTRDAVVRVIVTMREEAPLDERAVRAALGDAYLALPVERDIVNPRDQVRNPVLADRSLDPLAALDEYLKTRRFSEARRVLLREYAGRLLTDVERDEALDLERP